MWQKMGVDGTQDMQHGMVVSLSRLPFIATSLPLPGSDAIKQGSDLKTSLLKDMDGMMREMHEEDRSVSNDT